MVVATDVTTKRINLLKDNKKKDLPMRKPVVLNFKPSVSQKLIDAAVEKAISKYSSTKQPETIVYMDSNDNSFTNRVFINCPIDPGYDEIFKATIYTILACGFYPVSALQLNDGGLRLEKICKLIKSCKYSIHDLSMVDLDRESGLPRFNMPFELGIDFGYRNDEGSRDNPKCFLIFESSKHKLGVYLSDLAGSDPSCHIKKPELVIKEIRNWLNSAVNIYGKFSLPGDRKITETFGNFYQDLPGLCKDAELDVNSISYVDLANLMRTWIEKYPGLIKETPPK